MIRYDRLWVTMEACGMTQYLSLIHISRTHYSRQQSKTQYLCITFCVKLDIVSYYLYL